MYMNFALEIIFFFCDKSRKIIMQATIWFHFSSSFTQFIYQNHKTSSCSDLVRSCCWRLNAVFLFFIMIITFAKPFLRHKHLDSLLHILSDILTVLLSLTLSKWTTNVINRSLIKRDFWVVSRSFSSRKSGLRSPSPLLLFSAGLPDSYSILFTPAHPLC